MSTKFVMLGTVHTVAEKIARQWVRGVGKDAEFVDKSDGWYATLDSWPASVTIFLGATKPGLKSGDNVRLTLEKV